MKGLDGKIAMVTGGGSGIGRATAIALADCGVAVAVVDHNVTTGARTQRMLIDRGASALFVTADTADDKQVSDAVARIATEFAGLDILINCAAASRDRRSSPTASVGRPRRGGASGCLPRVYVGELHHRGDVDGRWWLHRVVSSVDA